MLAAGTQLGPYEIVAMVGAGGMGEVYKAYHRRLEREVAIKVLPTQFAQDAERLARFEREARAVAALSHPNIVVLHDCLTENGQTFVVMELLGGENLRQVLDQGAMSWRQAVAFGLAVAEGLAAAHSKGIVHRDLKPENIWVTADGRVKILDFGLARVEAPQTPPPGQPAVVTKEYSPAPTQTGVVLGTVGYMSPEQVRGQPADARSDIFSLGCVLYEMVCGRRAFQRETAAETQTAILREEPEPLLVADQGVNTPRPTGVVPPELERIILHCLVKNRDGRFQTARDLAFALQALPADTVTSRITGPQPVLLRRRLWSWAAAIITLVAMVGYGAWWVYDRDRPRTGSQVVVEQPATGQTPTLDTIAVLPFNNQSTDAEAGYLGDDITFSLTETLSRLGGLRVRSFTSSSQLKDKNKTPIEAGKELQVQAVISGTIQKRGEDCVIFIELVSVQEDQPLWKQRFQGKFADRLKLQQDIARELPTRLKLVLSGAKQQELSKLPTQNLEAHQLYVKGRLNWNKGTQEAAHTAVRLFQQAIDLDPNYALAHAGLADAYLSLQDNTVPPREACPRAKAAAERAMQLDPNLVEALTAMAQVTFCYDRDWVRAEKFFRRALEINPQYAIGHWSYAWGLAMLGRFDDALLEMQEAQRNDPLSILIAVDLNMPYCLMGQHDRAIEQIDKVKDLDPHFFLSHFTLGWNYVLMRKYDAAIQELKKASELEDLPWITGYLAYAHAATGHEAEARKLLSDLLKLREKRYVTAYHIAMVYAGLGEKDNAFKWLEQSYQDHSGNLTWLKVDPYIASLRSDPRYADLLRRMNFPE